MAREIERKFLVDPNWMEMCSFSKTPQILKQGYLFSEPGRSMRVRIDGMTGKSKVCYKAKTPGSAAGVLDRVEIEFDVPLDVAEALLEQCPHVVEKRRYKVPGPNKTDFLWDLDVFEGANEGLITAEVELEHPDQAFAVPPWLGKEVTADERYLNANLAENPYKNWKGDAEHADGTPEHCPW